MSNEQWNAVFTRIMTAPAAEGESLCDQIDRAIRTADAASPDVAAARRDLLERRRRWARSRPFKRTKKRRRRGGDDPRRKD